MSKQCKHKWKKLESTRGTNPPIVTGTSTWCEKCGVRHPNEVEAQNKEDMKYFGFNHLTTRNGDYR